MTDASLTTEAKPIHAEGLKEYEVSFLVDVEEGREEVKKALAQMEAKLTFEGPFAKISLAYPIKKNNAAYFGFFYFELSPAALVSLRETLSLKTNILRFLIVSPPIAKFKERRRVQGEEGSAAPKHRFTPSFKPPHEVRRESGSPLSNEDLEKKIEEILQ